MRAAAASLMLSGDWGLWVCGVLISGLFCVRDVLVGRGGMCVVGARDILYTRGIHGAKLNAIYRRYITQYIADVSRDISA